MVERGYEVGHCGVNAPAEGSFSVCLSANGSNGTATLTVDYARADVVDYIERFDTMRRVARHFDSFLGEQER